MPEDADVQGGAQELPLEPRPLPATVASAERFARTLKPGQAIGRIVIPRLSLNVVFVNGTDWLHDLSKGPGRYPSTSLPGLDRTTAIAGHRTTFGAWFRHIDRPAEARHDRARDAVRHFPLRGARARDRARIRLVDRPRPWVRHPGSVRLPSPLQCEPSLGGVRTPSQRHSGARTRPMPSIGKRRRLSRGSGQRDPRHVASSRRDRWMRMFVRCMWPATFDLTITLTFACPCHLRSVTSCNDRPLRVETAYVEPRSRPRLSRTMICSRSAGSSGEANEQSASPGHARALDEDHRPPERTDLLPSSTRAETRSSRYPASMRARRTPPWGQPSPKPCCS